MKIEDFANAGRLFTRIYEHNSVKGKTRLVAAKTSSVLRFQIGNLEKALGILRGAEKYVELETAITTALRDSLAEALRTDNASFKSRIKSFAQQATVVKHVDNERCCHSLLLRSCG